MKKKIELLQKINSNHTKKHTGNTIKIKLLNAVTYQKVN